MLGRSGPYSSFKATVVVIQTQVSVMLQSMPCMPVQHKLLTHWDVNQEVIVNVFVGETYQI